MPVYYDTITFRCVLCGTRDGEVYGDFCVGCDGEIDTYTVYEACACEDATVDDSYFTYNEHVSIRHPCAHDKVVPHMGIAPCEHNKLRAHNYKIPCRHDKTWSHTATEPASSSYPCTQGHTSYLTTNHYYCTIHAYLGTSSTCPGLTVNPQPSSVSLYYGQTQQITPNQSPSSASVSYTTNNANVADVSSSGLITAAGKGDTQIIVTGVIS